MMLKGSWRLFALQQVSLDACDIVVLDESDESGLISALAMRYTRRPTRKEEPMRDTFLADAQAALLALLFGDG
jgi:hypothetical protein